MSYTSEQIIKGNETIKIFMGFEYLTFTDKSSYTTTTNEIFFYAVNTLSSKTPLLKKKGLIIQEGIENAQEDVCYVEELNYHESIDSMLPVIEKIKLELFPSETSIKVIDILLDSFYGGYLLIPMGRAYVEGYKLLPKLELSAINLWSRVIEVINYINQGSAFVNHDKQTV
jgi:hypothetical protein